MLRLTESDLRFVVETVATRRRDYDHIVHLLRDKEDLLEPMLEDPKLLERLFRDEEAFLRISPHLLFSVLLRRVRIELEKEVYIFEAAPRGKRIPVFEAPAVAELLSNTQIRDYLADMLSSFARINSGVVYWKERGAWHKRRFSDVDIEDMIELARLADLEMRPALYKRIADIALFLSGIFPDQATLFESWPRATFADKPTLKDYEKQGRRFYGLAAREAVHAHWGTALEALAGKFTFARLALNTLSDRYLKKQRIRYFRVGM
jgi:hypothetical protein